MRYSRRLVWWKDDRDGRVILSSSEGCSWSSLFRNSVIVGVTRLIWKPMLVAMEERGGKESRPRGEMENERMKNFHFYLHLLLFWYRAKSCKSVFPGLNDQRTSGQPMHERAKTQKRARKNRQWDGLREGEAREGSTASEQDGQRIPPEAFILNVST